MSKLEPFEPKSEYGYPYSSAYTEADIRHFIGNSYSIKFDKETFEKHHECVGQKRKINQDVHDRYVRRFKPLVIDEDGRHNGTYIYNIGVGTAQSNLSPLPYIYRDSHFNESIIWFKAIHVSRSITHPRSYAVVYSSDTICFLCEKESEKIRHYHQRNIYDFKGRMECVCDECRNKYNLIYLDKDSVLVKLIQIKNTLLKVSSKAIEERK